MSKTTTNTYGANGGQSQTATASPTGSGASAAYGNAATPSNPAGNFQPSSTTDSQKNQTAYTYNGAGNQTSAKDAEAAQADVDYNDDGTVKTSTDPANKSSDNPTKYTYYSDKQVQTITPPTGNSLVKRDYTYDAFGRIRTQTDGAGNTQARTGRGNGAGRADPGRDRHRPRGGRRRGAAGGDHRRDRGARSGTALRRAGRGGGPTPGGGAALRLSRRSPDQAGDRPRRAYRGGSFLGDRPPAAAGRPGGRGHGREGYREIPLYGAYMGSGNSVCYERVLHQS